MKNEYSNEKVGDDNSCLDQTQVGCLSLSVSNCIFDITLIIECKAFIYYLFFYFFVINTFSDSV